jgi:hypothetical protein
MTNPDNLIINAEFLPETDWVITRSDGQPDTETRTLSDGRKYRQTFTYNSSNFMIKRSKWELVD